MKQNGSILESMSTEELSYLHDQLTALLTLKILEQKAELEKKLAQLQAKPRERRPYPRVPPKYRNPVRPSETWSGRGKQPRWVLDQLKKGKRLENFRIRGS